MLIEVNFYDFRGICTRVCLERKFQLDFFKSMHYTIQDIVLVRRGDRSNGRIRCIFVPSILYEHATIRSHCLFEVELYSLDELPELIRSDFVFLGDDIPTRYVKIIAVKRVIRSASSIVHGK